jgi:hypothetical protein
MIIIQYVNCAGGKQVSLAVKKGAALTAKKVLIAKCSWLRYGRVNQITACGYNLWENTESFGTHPE